MRTAAVLAGLLLLVPALAGPPAAAQAVDDVPPTHIPEPSVANNWVLSLILAVPFIVVGLVYWAVTQGPSYALATAESTRALAQRIADNTPTPSPRLEERPPRLLGGEILVLQMDADDQDQPRVGLTRDATIYQRHGDWGWPLRPQVPNVEARHGEGLRLGETSQYVALDNAATSSLPQGSFLLWIRMDAMEIGFDRILAKVDPGVTGEMGLMVDSADGRLSFGTSQAGGSTELRSATPLEVGEWTHVAVTWGPPGKRIYLNGVLDAADADPVGVGSKARVTALGTDPNNAGKRGLKATVDEVRFYSRALAPDEIRLVMESPYAS